MTQMMNQNLCDTAKADLRGSLQQFKKQEKPQINNLILHLKQLEKEKQNPKLLKERNHKDQSRKNETEIKKTIANISKTKSWFFEIINKTDKPLARIIKKKRGGTQINKIRNEQGEIRTDMAEIQS